MIALPDHWCERIRIYRAAERTDDLNSEKYFRDPTVRQQSTYNSANPVRAGWVVAEGSAYPQEERIGVQRSSPTARVEAVSFFDMYWIVQLLDGEIPEIDFGETSRQTQLYLIRLDKDQDIRYSIVLVRYYPNGATHIYVTDPREGRSTQISPR